MFQNIDPPPPDPHHPNPALFCVCVCVCGRGGAVQWDSASLWKWDFDHISETSCSAPTPTPHPCPPPPPHIHTPHVSLCTKRDNPSKLSRFRPACCEPWDPNLTRVFCRRVKIVSLTNSCLPQTACRPEAPPLKLAGEFCSPLGKGCNWPEENVRLVSSAFPPAEQKSWQGRRRPEANARFREDGNLTLLAGAISQLCNFQEVRRGKKVAAVRSVRRAETQQALSLNFFSW